MKKGMFIFALMAILVFSFSQVALANVTLNVNAKSATTANKLYYFTGVDQETQTTVSLPWKEKAVYGDMGNLSITVKNAKAGYLVVKLQLVSCTTGAALGASSPTAVTCSSIYYLFQYTSGSALKTLELKPVETALSNWQGTGADAVTKFGGADPPSIKNALKVQDPDDLANLAPASLTDPADVQIPANTTITLMDYVLAYEFDGYIVITAILIDNFNIAPPTIPQIIGVDTQTIFLNNVPLRNAANASGIWKYIIRMQN